MRPHLAIGAKLVGEAADELVVEGEVVLLADAVEIVVLVNGLESGVVIRPINDAGDWAVVIIEGIDDFLDQPVPAS
jgi:hypothetical protein